MLFNIEIMFFIFPLFGQILSNKEGAVLNAFFVQCAIHLLKKIPEAKMSTE